MLQFYLNKYLNIDIYNIEIMQFILSNTTIYLKSKEKDIVI